MIGALVLVAAEGGAALVTCAALWTGYGDLARASPLLDGTQAAAAQAARFADLAAQAGVAPARVRDGVAVQREAMFFLARAALGGGDRMSRELFERQMLRCQALDDAAG